MKKTAIGAYGPWAASLNAASLPLLSLRRPEIKSLSAWCRKALAKTLELVAEPESAPAGVRVHKPYVWDGLAFEELSWQLPCGPRTEAVFVKPAGSKGRLPAVLALHDHGGIKFFGWRKITRTGPKLHPLIARHQNSDYGGAAWVNELARRGYAVLCHDVFAFGSRRVRYEDTLQQIVPRGKESSRPAEAAINEYNRFAGSHESVMAKSLFCAGTTWPGVTLSEDRRALDYLLSRRDVDPRRIGCCGLSGGGLRTVYLAGLDHRVRSAVCVGFMSTWRDFLLNKSWTHTWMTYTPLLPNYLEFPEILGLRVPLPTLVQSCTEDPLYTVPEMKAAARILKSVYRKAGAPANYRALFYPGGHKFDLPMQKDAFDWFDRMM